MKFSNKKIAILGLGIEGQDVSQYLLKKKVKITVFDQKSASELGEAYKNFKKQGVEFRLEKNYLGRGLEGFEIIFRSPAFRRLMLEILQAEKKGAVILSATKLFFDLCPAKIIGVTGTKGKGTTATLIYRILKKSGKKVFLAGNIGQPMLALLPKLTKDSWVVLELSSFQLQDLTRSPHIAVVLFIVPEHLDYHQDEKEYIQAKSNILRHQKGSDLSVLNGDNPISSSFASLTQAKVYYFSRQKKVNGAYVQNETFILNGKIIGSVKKLQLRGAHNWDNVCAAITASALTGADLASIKKAVFSFSGLEHRLEKVKVLKGVSFYNDSFSTTPETAMAAIKAFEKPIILIAGGSEKGSDYTNLGREIAQSSVKTLILIGQMATRIKKAVNKAGFKGEIIFRPGGMREIVKAAFKKAKPGDIVLLSPACASFDMFANYKVRGKQFKTHVKALKTDS